MHHQWPVEHIGKEAHPEQAPGAAAGDREMAGEGLRLGEGVLAIGQSEGHRLERRLDDVGARRPGGEPVDDRFGIGIIVRGALACIARGIAVLVEKPVADTLAEALRLADAVERSGVPVLVGHHRRHSAAMAAAREAIDSGVLGRLVAVQGSALFHKPASYFDEAPWRREKGSGPILNNLVHEMDNLRMLAGEIDEVQAMASNARRGHPVEDTVSISLRFANGALGSFMLSDVAASTRSWEQTAGENAAYARDETEACYLVSGDRGSLAVPTLRLQTARGPEASWFEPMRDQRLGARLSDPLQRQLEHFASVIRREQAPLVGVRDATRSLQATLAVAESAARGCPMRCDKMAA